MTNTMGEIKENTKRLSDHLHVSVAMCTYNGEKYIKEQLESILNQTVRPDEIVICDDMSNDSTLSIIHETIRHITDMNIRLYTNESQLGVAQNFMKAMSLCSGDVVFFCDQDDVWFDTKVAQYVDIFESDSSVKGVLSDATLADEKLVSLNKSLWESLGFTEKMRRRITSGRAHRVLGKQPFVTGAVLAVRKEYFPHVIIPQGNRILHDEWLGWLINNDLAFIEEPTIYYRQHAVQQEGAHYFKSTVEHMQYIAEIMTKQEVSRFPQVEDFEQLKQALIDSGVCTTVITCIQEKIQFIRYRQQLPRTRLKRMLYVLTNGVPGRKYEMYSNGLKGIIKDLIRKVD